MCTNMHPWWRHQIETSSALLDLCAGISPATGYSPHKGQWRGALMFSMFCAWVNGWINNREAGDLRRHRAHYDVIVMKPIYSWLVRRMKFYGYVNHCLCPDSLMTYFLIWNHSVDQLTEFIHLFNSHDESNKIDRNNNVTSVDFCISQYFKALDFLQSQFSGYQLYLYVIF